MPKQKPTPKIFSFQTFKADMIDPALGVVGGTLRKIFGLKDGWLKNPDIIYNNYELGRMHFAQGNLSDATLRFTIVTFFDKNHAEAWDYLGRSQLISGKAGKAVISLRRSLSLNPKNPEAAYLLVVALGKKAPANMLPKSMPRVLALEHFDELAANYNNEQLNDYKYQGHIMLSRAIREHVGQTRIDHQLLDLGTGTGLCGAQLRDIAGQLTGVDFSPRMLDVARELRDDNGNRIFNELVQQEVHEFLRASQPASYDIVVSGGMLSYIGEVEELAQLVATSLKPGGIFAFTVDPFEGTGYQFLPEGGRFGYSQSFLQELAGRHGMEVVLVNKAEIYPGYFAWLCVFKK